MSNGGKAPSSLVPVVAGFGIVLLLLVAVAAVGVTHIRKISGELTAIVSERNQKAEIAATMHGLHEARYRALMLAASLDDPFERDEEVMRYSRLALDFIQARDRFLALPLDEEEFNLWNTLREEVRQIEAKNAGILELIRKESLREARQQIQRDLAGHQQVMTEGWSRLLAMQRSKNQLALQEAEAINARASRLSVGLSASALVVGCIVTVFVVRRSRKLEKDLFEEKEQAQVTLQSIADGVVRFDTELRVSFLNRAAEFMVGLSLREVRNRPLTDALDLFARQEERTSLLPPLTEEVLGGHHADLPPTACLLSAHGMEVEVEGTCSPIHSPEGGIEGGVLILRDVTEAREMQRKLMWQADHDGLTGLVNRRAFEERVSRTLTSKRSGDYPLSLMFIDLDHFKQVNDGAGHAAGDELLRLLARLMQTRVREGDMVARLGGDEFGVMLFSCPADMAEKIAGLLRESVSNLQFEWEGRSYPVGASIGVVHLASNWMTLDECLAAADAACYKAKNSGRNGIVVHGKDT
ncbi:MAG: diguanylate cyclase [Pseudomonadota bacterium]